MANMVATKCVRGLIVSTSAWYPRNLGWKPEEAGPSSWRLPGKFV
jgi:hypothetical protein